jgi:hypothetical protein
MIHDLHAKVLDEVETFSRRSSINLDEGQRQELFNSVDAVFNRRILGSITGNTSLQAIPRRSLQSPKLPTLSSNTQPEVVPLSRYQPASSNSDENFQNSDEFTNCISVNDLTYSNFVDENDVLNGLTELNQLPQSTGKGGPESDENSSSRTTLHPFSNLNLVDFAIYSDENWEDNMDTSRTG